MLYFLKGENMKKIKLCLVFLLLCGCGKEVVYDDRVKPAGSDIKLLVGSDLHYIAPQLKEGSELFEEVTMRSDGKNMIYIEEITDSFVEEVITVKPDAILLTGDITYNGEKESHIELAKKLTKIKDAGIKVLVINGNHDINNFGSYKFLKNNVEKTDSISGKEFKEIYQDFGYSDAILTDRNSLSYVSAISEDLWVFMIDTVPFELNSEMIPAYSMGEIKPQTIKWVEESLKQAKDKGAKVMFGMHHNLFYHSPLFEHGYRLEDNEPLLNLMKNYDVPLAVSGHIHLQNIIKDEETQIVDIASGALSVNAHALGHIEFNPTKGFVYEAKPIDVEGWARNEGLRDEKLLTFSDFSRKFYIMAAYNRELNRIDEGDEEALLQAQVMSLLNGYYFSGTVNDEVRKQYLEDEVIQSILKDSDSRRAIYINSILLDKGYNDLKISIE